MQAIKYSRQREAIMHLLAKRTDHPTADMIYTDIRKEFPNISLGTVYRNLALLSELREIRKLSTGDGIDHYDADTSPHPHFTCKICHRVEDVPLESEELKHLLKIASDSFDGTIDGVDINFFGTCKSCKENSSI